MLSCCSEHLNLRAPQNKHSLHQPFFFCSTIVQIWWTCENCGLNFLVVWIQGSNWFKFVHWTKHFHQENCNFKATSITLPPLQRKKEKKENINNCNTKMYEIWKVTSWTAVSEFAPLVLILWFKTAMVNMLIIPYVKCDVNTTPSQFISSELGQYTSKWCQKV